MLGRDYIIISMDDAKKLIDYIGGDRSLQHYSILSRHGVFHIYMRIDDEINEHKRIADKLNLIEDND